MIYIWSEGRWWNDKCNKQTIYNEHTHIHRQTYTNGQIMYVYVWMCRPTLNPIVFHFIVIITMEITFIYTLRLQSEVRCIVYIHTNTLVCAQCALHMVICSLYLCCVFDDFELFVVVELLVEILWYYYRIHCCWWMILMIAWWHLLIIIINAPQLELELLADMVMVVVVANVALK